MLYEGKAKKIFSTNESEYYWVEYKDSATAFNGEKKEDFIGKGALNNKITSLIFSRLSEAKIPNHFVKQISETEQIVEKVTIIPVEVVVRNIVAGSLSKRLGITEGSKIEKPIIEFYYKNDDLGDPLINEDHIKMLNLANDEIISKMKSLAHSINGVLQDLFSESSVNLIDFKVEFGLTTTGDLILADEISPDTCRLWDKETGEKLDKDVFRRGIGKLTDAYEEILKRLGGAHV
ncbi:MAG: phosphoribosylaminoimidazole-succinocarboxamide synthase [Bacillales bacterium]|jgi:phosphoribosylaminoimidazole-succinocarboxamide synthase|nr:phosphoribosylaminoimidazole-succinocarboxamide synthase [Bacillales bacterium]